MPKIVLIETKQINPDKILSGQSSTFNVLINIQLSKVSLDNRNSNNNNNDSDNTIACISPKSHDHELKKNGKMDNIGDLAKEGKLSININDKAVPLLSTYGDNIVDGIKNPIRMNIRSTSDVAQIANGESGSISNIDDVKEYELEESMTIDSVDRESNALMSPTGAPDNDYQRYGLNVPQRKGTNALSEGHDLDLDHDQND